MTDTMQTKQKPSYTLPLERTGDNVAPSPVFTEAAVKRWEEEDRAALKEAQS